MIWLTWRQFRAQAVTAAVVLAAMAILLLVTGIGLSDTYNSNGVAGCHGASACNTAASNFISQIKADPYHLVFHASVFLVYAAPALIGVFWGAPLVTREIEAGTFRLAWNQSVTRRRWLAVKLGLIGLAAMATSGLLSLMTSWWSSPIYAAAQLTSGQNSLSLTRLDPPLFGAQGIAPIGYAAFAFALGVTLGALIRLTVPAMAATLAAFGGVQLAWALEVRQHLISPVRISAPLNVNAINELTIQNGQTITVVAAAHNSSGWVLTNQTVTSAGRPFTGPPTAACLTGTPQQCNAWLASQHLRQLVTYQPVSRFWEFQWYETAIFVVAALALGALCTWLIRSRRIA
jgi:hypothetical protein